MIRMVLFLFTLMMNLMAFSVPSYAVTQSDINRAGTTSIEQQKQEQLRTEHDFKELKERGKKGAKIVVPFEKRDTSSEDTRCWTFHQIILNGVTLISNREQQKVFDRYIDKCMTLADINELMNDLTALFFVHGYVTSRVYLAPSQDLSKNVLTLIGVEGVLEGIRLKDGKNDRSIALGMAFPGLIGKPLNLRDIEQGMEQINRLPSNNATIDIQPGKKPGASVLLVKNAMKETPFTYSLTHDNQGSIATGKQQSSFSFFSDNPMGLNDSFGLTMRSTHPVTDTYKLSRSLTANYSLGYGYTTFSFSGSSSDYVMRIPLSSGAEAKSSGSSLVVTGGLEHLVYRGQSDKLTVSASLSSNQNKNYLEDSLITVSSYNLSVLDLGVAYSTRLLGGSLSAGVGYVKGLDIFSAKKDLSTANPTAARAQFNKFRYNLNYFRPLNILGDDFQISSSLTGQYSKDVLYGAEQISIGGLYTVRGYEGVSITGDTGLYVRNALTWTPQWVRSHVLEGNGSISPYIAYDKGWIKSHFDSNHGMMSGVTYGVKMELWGIFQSDLSYSVPVSFPSYLTAPVNRAFFNMSLVY